MSTIAGVIGVGRNLSRTNSYVKSLSTYEKIRFFIWNSLEQETPSTFGAIINITIVLLICINLLCIILETEPLISEQFDFISTTFLIIETVFTFIFSVEVILRIWSSESSKKYKSTRWTSRCRYIFSFWNLIDLLSVLPALVYVTIRFYARFVVFDEHLEATFGNVLFVFRLLRFLRCIRLHYFFNVFGILKKVITSKIREFVVSLILVFSVVIFFGMFMYIAEKDVNPAHFGSIPRSLYFVMVTLATIGYGDVVPQTFFGKFCVTVGAFLPLAVFGIPISVIASGLIEELQNDTQKMRADLIKNLNKEKDPNVKKKSIKERLGWKAVKSTKAKEELERKSMDQPRATSEEFKRDGHHSNSNDSLVSPRVIHEKTGSFDDTYIPKSSLDLEPRTLPINLPKFDKKETVDFSVLRFINDEESIIYDIPTIQFMMKNQISLSGIFYYSKFNPIDKVQKLNGISSIREFEKIIDEGKYKMKDVNKLIQSIDRMVDMWKMNKLNHQDEEILSKEANYGSIDTENNSKLFIKEHMESLSLVVYDLLIQKKFGHLQRLINERVKKLILLDKYDLFNDLKEVSLNEIKSVLNDFCNHKESVISVDDLTVLFENFRKKDLSVLPKWMERKEKLKKLFNK